MREQLRQIISATRGPQAWQELVKTEADIRKKRQETIYAQKERQKHFIEIAVIIGATIIGVALVFFVIWLITQG
jgi:CHASE3 domain sensor protein